MWACPQEISGEPMNMRIVTGSILALTLLSPIAAQAQGVPGGIERGSREGKML